MSIVRDLEPKVAKQVEEYFRQVFDNDPGHRVLGYILTELSLFDHLDTEEKVANHNYAIHLLQICGVLQPHNFKDLSREIFQHRGDRAGLIKKLFKYRGKE